MIKRTIEISTGATYLSVKNEQLVIRRDREVVGTVPCEDIGILIVDHPGVTYTHGLLTSLARVGAVKVHESHLSVVYQLRDHPGGPRYKDRFMKWDFGGEITENFPMTWTQGAVVSLSEVSKHEGETSLAITADGTQPSISVWTKPILLDIFVHSLTAGTWLRPTQLWNSHLIFQVEFRDAGGTVVKYSNRGRIAGPMNKWRFHAISLNRDQWPPRARTARVGLTFRGYNGVAPRGAVFMSNLTVTLGGDVASPEEVDREPGRDVARQGTDAPR